VQFRLLNPGAPIRITYYLRGPMTGNSPWMSFRLGTTSCFDFGVANGRWYSKGALNGAASANTWYFIDMRPNFATSRLDIYVDGNQVGSQVAFASQCSAIDFIIAFANLGQDSSVASYLDEMTVYCTEAGVTSAPATTPAPYTPAPQTPAPAPATPAPPKSCMDSCVARGCRTASVTISHGTAACSCSSCSDTTSAYCAGTTKCDYPSNGCFNIGGQPKCLTVVQTPSGLSWSNWLDCQQCSN
jgi:hypothetical protein